MRRFEKISFEQFEKDFANYDNSIDSYESIVVPNRGTGRAAGYDFFAPISFTLLPNEIIKMPTGIKVTMESDEFLMIVVRSSTGFKYNVRMCNQIGIIDADYYNNVGNEGHMWIALQNEGAINWVVNKGDRVVQGIFVKYLLTDDDSGAVSNRQGGLGSTNKEE